jgi:hypothetical protein
MTHDELLAKIDEEGEFLVQYFDSKPIVHSALRAIVELHYPVIHALPDETCWACQDLYPCPTIQAIEKEME